MISLKKHLDERYEVPADLLRAFASAYRTALLSMSRAAVKTSPSVGEELSRDLNGNLAILQAAPNCLPSPAKVAEVDRRVAADLESWGERAADYFREKTAEVKEILLLVTRSAQSTGEKDEKYVAKLGDFSTRLSAIANLDDLTSIRQSLMQSAKELRSCVDNMAEDGKELVTRLRSQVASYESRLHEAEKQASVDVLTGLDNRRGIEAKMEARMALGRRFSVILFDLNGFKTINDAHGHLAGDELLKQFGTELRGRFRAGDAAGRWGGDEFLVVFDGSEQQAHSALRKATEWLFGEYRLKSVKVAVSAAAGVAEWNGREAVGDLLKRADANMYLQKKPRLV